MSELILRFDEIGADDLPLVGGKGANLGEMTNAGLPVPPGFCATTVAYDQFFDGVEGGVEMLRALDALDPDDTERVRELGAEVRATLESTPIPSEVRTALEDEFGALDHDDAWAVRSSATLEDLEDASFAGQQDTYLNVRGVDALLDAVRRCWASLFTDRAILYRRRRGFGSESVKLSVVVQRMVDSDVSGILFTADPVTGHRRICSIDASYGLGEALVSGLVDADNYRVDRRTGELVEERIGAKMIEIVGTADGTEQRDVEVSLRDERSLTTGQIDELVSTAAAVESHFGGRPQDIEWAFESNELWLVQSRPITTLFPIPEPRPDDGLHVYVSFGHVQVMTEPMTPLGRDVIRLVLPVGKGAGEPSEMNPLVLDAGERLWVDLSPALKHAPLRSRIPGIMTVVDPTMGALVGEVASRPEFRRSDVRPANMLRFAWTFALPMLWNTFWNLVWRDQQRVRDRATEVLEGVVAEAKAALDVPDTPARLRAARRSIGLALLTLFPRVMPVVLAAITSLKFLESRFGKGAVDALSRGLRGNVTTDMDLELADIADVARRTPAVADFLRDEPNDEEFEAARRRDGFDDFFAAWDHFVERYGHRGPGEIDIGRPRWEDHPRSLVQTLVGMMADPALGGHRSKHDALAAEADACGEQLVDDAGFGRRWWVRRLVANVRNYMALREHPKFYLMQVFERVRTVLLEAADELVERGALDDRHDVFMLRFDTVQDALTAGDTDLRPVVEEARVRRRRFDELRPPRVITNDGETPQPPKRTDLPPGALAGVSASTGVVEGRARVIFDPTGEVLHAGEILVAPFSDPGWTPLFIHAAGLVMEVGGLMTHGSVVAREYGIPAVVGVDDATRKIETGQQIRVDGDTGVVEILEEEA